MRQLQGHLTIAPNHTKGSHFLLDLPILPKTKERVCHSLLRGRASRVAIIQDVNANTRQPLATGCLISAVFTWVGTHLSKHPR